MSGKTWRDGRWLEAGVLPAAGILMTITWLGPWLESLLHLLVRGYLGAAGLGAGLLLAAGAALAAVTRNAPRARWWLAGGGLAAGLLAEWGWLYRGTYSVFDGRWLGALALQVGDLSPGPVFLLGVAAWLWWWGTRADWANHQELARGFVIGVLAFGLGLGLAAGGAVALPADLAARMVMFLLIGWGALALAGVRAATLSDREADPMRLNRYWLGVVALILAGLFGGGLALVSVLSPQTLAAAVAVLRPIWQALGGLVYLLVAALAYVTFYILSPLIDFLRGVESGLARPTPAQIPTLEDIFEGLPAEAAAADPTLTWVLRLLVILVVVTGLGLLFAAAWRRWGAANETEVPESRDLIWSWDLLRAQLTEAWAGRPRPLPEFWPLPQDHVAAVRAAYRQVLTAARARGLVRRPRQTPAGFLAALRTLWPDEAPLLEALTRLYVAARYGQVPPPEAEWAAVRAGLGRIAAPDEHPKT